MKMIKEDQESKQDINIETYLKKKKNKKREYGRNRDHNMSKKKTKTKRISKNYCEAKKSQFNNQYMI